MNKNSTSRKTGVLFRLCFPHVEIAEAVASNKKKMNISE